jgi:hypothetical protein
MPGLPGVKWDPQPATLSPAGLVNCDQYSKAIHLILAMPGFRCKRAARQPASGPHELRLAMLTTLLKSFTGAAFLSSLFLWSARDCAVLLLAVWMVSIGVFVLSNLADRFLWIPVLLALAGVFASVFALVIPANIILAVNVATLVSFIVSLEVLKKKNRSWIVLMGQRA